MVCEILNLLHRSEQSFMAFTATKSKNHTLTLVIVLIYELYNRKVNTEQRFADFLLSRYIQSAELYQNYGSTLLLVKCVILRIKKIVK